MAMSKALIQTWFELAGISNSHIDKKRERDVSIKARTKARNKLKAHFGSIQCAKEYLQNERSKKADQTGV